MTADTIAALATARGPAALAIVRVSGPDAIPIVARHFRPGERITHLPSHRCAVGEFVDAGGEAIDQVVATVFRAPGSYTGEDLVEISSHGSDRIAARMLAALHGSGARPAHPGEFTQRAFLNGKLDLAQAEAVAALVSARSEASARAALRILAGGLRGALDESMDHLADALACLEAGLDFDEHTSPRAIAAELEAEAGRLDRLLAGARAGRCLDEGLRVVLAGRPNAGKSSILNAFLSRPRAIVSPHPGTTRDVLEASVDWGGLPIVLIDTAGLGESSDCLTAPGSGPPPVPAASHAAPGSGDAHDSLLEESRRRSREALRSAVLVVHVVDAAATDPPQAAEDQARMGLFGDGLLVALHKWDLGARPAWREPDGIPSSVVAAPGIEPLRRAILARLRTAGEEAEAGLLVGDRQRDLVARAREAVVRARDIVTAGAGEELAAFELREALERFGELLGRRAGPLVLERIFSGFCIGK